MVFVFLCAFFFFFSLAHMPLPSGGEEDEEEVSFLAEGEANVEGDGRAETRKMRSLTSSHSGIGVPHFKRQSSHPEMDTRSVRLIFFGLRCCCC